MPKRVIHPKGVQLKGKAVLDVPMSILHEFKVNRFFNDNDIRYECCIHKVFEPKL
jgi:hypothetical protein